VEPLSSYKPLKSAEPQFHQEEQEEERREISKKPLLLRDTAKSTNVIGILNRNIQ